MAFPDSLRLIDFYRQIGELIGKKKEFLDHVFVKILIKKSLTGIWLKFNREWLLSDREICVHFSNETFYYVPIKFENLLRLSF